MWYIISMNIFLDTETTGLKEPRLVELAYRSKAMGMVVIRCKPPKEIELEAIVVNGIRNKDVENLISFAEHPYYSDIKELLESNTVIAHNVSFDVMVLANEGINCTSIIDTKKLAQEKWPEAPSHRLQHLRYWLDLEVEGVAHTAAGDVQVLMALWDRLQRD